eukprot:360147-Chlamydomonas_euryale.AAC.7
MTDRHSLETLCEQCGMSLLELMVRRQTSSGWSVDGPFSGWGIKVSCGRGPHGTTEAKTGSQER